MSARFDNDDITRLRIALGRISRFLDRQSRGDRLTRSETSVLASVTRLGPVRLSELADLEGVNPTMLSRVMGVLEQKGLILRSSATSDQRGVVAEATVAGRETSRRIMERRTAILLAVVERLPEQTAAALLAALPALEELTGAFAERKPTLAREG